MFEVGGDGRVDLREEHEDAERYRERDDQVLAAAKLQHKFRFRLREHRVRLHRRAFTARRGRPPAVATEGSVTTASAGDLQKDIFERAPPRLQ